MVVFDPNKKTYNMRQNLHFPVLFILVLTCGLVASKYNSTKSKTVQKKHSNKEKIENYRTKRSPIEESDDIPFWPQRGKKPNTRSLNFGHSEVNIDNTIDKEPPFWGTRGRRDSSESAENYVDAEYPEIASSSKYCKHCGHQDNKFKDRREELITPFWGNHGRRFSNEIDEESDQFWGSRGRRHENDPFWGNRGRRQEEEPFWGNRGRREEEPFWGNRGRREDPEPFWGNRGRREENEPFWGTRGRRLEEEPFWGNRGRRKEDLKESIMNAIKDVEDDIQHLSRLRRDDLTANSFWANRQRESKLKYLFNGPVRSRYLQNSVNTRANYGLSANPLSPNTIHDSRIFAEEPHYIIVERSSRSSGEDDPFYISRGKKKFANNLFKAARGRRGAIEEIVKSVRNDPFYIARGKKDTEKPNENSTVKHDVLEKVKELICSTVDFVQIKNEGNRTKREIDDNERDRRTILKKLAAQLQMDPYYVSRGKKNDIPITDEENLDNFINEIALSCN